MYHSGKIFFFFCYALNYTVLPTCSYVVLPQPVCLEQGVSYTVQLEFTRYGGREHLQGAAVLLDSVSTEWGELVYLTSQGILGSVGETLASNALSLSVSLSFPPEVGPDATLLLLRDVHCR